MLDGIIGTLFFFVVTVASDPIWDEPLTPNPAQQEEIKND